MMKQQLGSYEAEGIIKDIIRHDFPRFDRILRVDQHHHMEGDRRILIAFWRIKISELRTNGIKIKFG